MSLGMHKGFKIDNACTQMTACICCLLTRQHHVCCLVSHLQVHISNVLAQRYSSLPVNDLHADGRIALGLQDIIDQVLWGEIDIAAAMGVVLTQHTLRVQAAQAPANNEACLS